MLAMEQDSTVVCLCGRRKLTSYRGIFAEVASLISA